MRGARVVTAPRFAGFTNAQHAEALAAGRTLIGCRREDDVPCPPPHRRRVEQQLAGKLRRMAADVGLELEPSSVEHVWTADGLAVRSTGWAPWRHLRTFDPQLVPEPVDPFEIGAQHPDERHPYALPHG